MTSLPTPRYSIGETVYRPSIDPTLERLPCPDCLDTREWLVTNPAGVQHRLSCPRCSRESYQIDNRVPSLTIQRYAPRVTRLTIGSITVKTHPHSGDDPVEYMAIETGVGSGSLYRERSLYPTEEMALAAAQTDAALKNAEIDTKREVIAARHFSSLYLTDAAITALRDGVYNSWATYRNLRWQIEDLLPEDDKNDSEIEQALRHNLATFDRYFAENFLGIKHPLDELLAAIDPSDDPTVVAALARFRERTKLMAKQGEPK